MRSFLEALQVHVAALATAHGQEVSRLQAEIRRLTEQLAGSRPTVFSDPLEGKNDKNTKNQDGEDEVESEIEELHIGPATENDTKAKKDKKDKKSHKDNDAVEKLARDAMLDDFDFDNNSISDVEDDVIDGIVSFQVSEEKSDIGLLPKGFAFESMGSQLQMQALVAEAEQELEDITNIHKPHASSDAESNGCPPPCALSGPEERRTPVAAISKFAKAAQRGREPSLSSSNSSHTSCKSQKPSSKAPSSRRVSTVSTLSSRLKGSLPERRESDCVDSHRSFNRLPGDSLEEESDSGSSQATSVAAAFKLLEVWNSSFRSGALLGSGRSKTKENLGAVPVRGDISRAFSLETTDEIHPRVRWKTYEVNQTMKSMMCEPSSMTNLLWQAISLVFIMSDVFTVPLEVFNICETLGVLLWLSCGFWTMDILRSFFTGYIKAQGVVEMRFLKVARRYVKSWLPLDAVCTMCDWVMLISSVSSSETGVVNDLLKPASVLRVLRLMRLLKAPEIEAFLEEYFRSEMTSVAVGIAKAIALLLGIAHIIACAWYSIGNQALRSNDLASLTVFERYTLSLHWSLAQFVGESLLEVQSVSEHSFAMCILMFAFVFSALFISSITTAMTRIQVLRFDEASQNRELHYYLLDHAISTSLAMRVTRNAHYAVAERKKQAPESSISLLQLVSEPLRAELHFEMRAPVLSVHPFFECYREVNAVGVREVCHLAVSPLSVSTGDIIFSELETPVNPRMFFMTGEGTLQYFRKYAVKEGSRISALDTQCDCGLVQKGGWAGEPVLWTDWMHRGSLRAESDCILLAVDAKGFQRIVSPFPTQHATVYGEAFLEALNAVPLEELTDLKTDDQDVCVHSAFPSKYSANDDSFGKRQSARWSVSTSPGSPWSSRVSSRWSSRASGRFSAAQFTDSTCDTVRDNAWQGA